MLLIDDLRVGIRPALPEDQAFIAHSWLESFHDAHAAGPIPNDMYKRVYSEIIRRIVNRSAVLVAYNGDEPDQILGWLCYEPGIVHYSFVKAAFRRNGIFRALLGVAGVDPRQPFTYTFKSSGAGRIVKHLPGARFNPLAARMAPREPNP